MKAMTLRLDDTDAATLAALARVDDQSRAAVLRHALRRHADARRTAPGFVERALQLHTDEAHALGLAPATDSKEPTS
jgi:predicted transcriptional regulator